jgi:hypothetical protein
MSNRNIKAGWRGAGLVPWNLNKALFSSLILQAIADTPKSPPSTRESHENRDIHTPRNRRQLQRMMDQVEATESLSRPLRTLLRKTSKAIDEFCYTQAAHMTQIAGQERKIEEIRGPKRRKIAINAQERFADITTVKAAQDKEREAAEQGEAYAERVGRALARRTANQMQDREIEACMTVWQL